MTSNKNEKVVLEENAAIKTAYKIPRDQNALSPLDQRNLPTYLIFARVKNMKSGGGWGIRLRNKMSTTITK